MSKGQYILVDGTFCLAEEYQMSGSRAECFMFSEKVRAIRCAFPFFRESLELIRLKFALFNCQFPEFTEPDGAGLRRQLERTMTKNKLFQGACFQVNFYFENKQVHYSIQSEKLMMADYVLNEKGIYLEIFDKIQKPVSPLSNLNLGSEVIWNLAQAWKPAIPNTEMLILNTEDQVVETPQSNIYLITGQSVRSAGKGSGAYIDSTANRLPEVFNRLKLLFSDEESISTDDLKEADEVMLVNSIDGIRWVAGFEGKRYFNTTIRRLNEVFNLMATS